MTGQEGTVYIVEDDEALSRALVRSLEMRGYKVAAFGSADSFLETLTPTIELPACLVLDYGLPGMNGLELQQHLVRKQVPLPIVFITGHGGIPESVQATKAGAVDFLEKPYKPAVLIDRIETGLALSRQMAAETQRAQELQANVDRLTEREAEVFHLILRKPNQASSKAMANDLGISPRTADIHRSRVLEKTGCSTVAGLVMVYKDFTEEE